MELTLEQIKNITSGVEDIKFENDVFRFLRFTEDEYETVEKSIALCTAGIEMNFITDAHSLELNVVVRKAMSIRSMFAYDIYLDDVLIGHIRNFDEEDKTQMDDYTNNEFETGRFNGKFNLGDGEKKVRIVFPYSVISEIENITLDGASYITPVKKEKLLIAYGDSITQGYDAIYPSDTYAVKLSDFLGCELINKGIGGSQFNHALAREAKRNSADVITVAYGTNDWNACTIEEFRENLISFTENITAKFPNTPTFFITPIWRKSCDDISKLGKFSDVDLAIKEVCKEYKNITVIPGFNLIEHDENYLGDFIVHPNSKGFDMYFENLKRYFV